MSTTVESLTAGTNRLGGRGTKHVCGCVWQWENQQHAFDHVILINQNQWFDWHDSKPITDCSASTTMCLLLLREPITESILHFTAIQHNKLGWTSSYTASWYCNFGITFSQYSTSIYQALDGQTEFSVGVLCYFAVLSYSTKFAKIWRYSNRYYS